MLLTTTLSIKQFIQAQLSPIPDEILNRLDLLSQYGYTWCIITGFFIIKNSEEEPSCLLLKSQIYEDNFQAFLLGMMKKVDKSPELPEEKNEEPEYQAHFPEIEKQKKVEEERTRKFNDIPDNIVEEYGLQQIGLYWLETCYQFDVQITKNIAHLSDKGFYLSTKMKKLIMLDPQNGHSIILESPISLIRSNDLPINGKG